MQQFKSKLSAESGHLSEGEREELVQEMMAKMDKMNFLLNKEDQHQQKRMREMLDKRQKKKQDLNNVLNKLNDKRSTAQQGYDSQLMDIVTKEQLELEGID